MINPTGNNVTPDFIHYAAPLIRGELAPTYRNGVPMHISLY